MEVYTNISAPLNNFQYTDSPEVIPKLTEDQESYFRKNVTVVTPPPVLALPENGFTYSVYIDASSYQVGAALLQTYEEYNRIPVWVCSFTLNEYEILFSKWEGVYRSFVGIGHANTSPSLWVLHFTHGSWNPMMAHEYNWYIWMVQKTEIAPQRVLIRDLLQKGHMKLAGRRIIATNDQGMYNCGLGSWLNTLLTNIDPPKPRKNIWEYGQHSRWPETNRLKRGRIFPHFGDLINKDNTADLRARYYLISHSIATRRHELRVNPHTS